MKKVVIISQARTGSTRLPKKVLKKIGNITMLEIHLERVLMVKYASEIILATTDNEKDDIIELIGQRKGVKVYRGSENDVLDRYYQAAKMSNADVIVRITSDCPLIDPKLIDNLIQEHLKNKKDFTSNIIDRFFPDGLDIEIFNFENLEKAWLEANNPIDREHVTFYIWQNSDLMGKSIFTAHNVITPDEQNYSDFRMTLDYLDDFYMFKNLISKLGIYCNWLEYVLFLKENPLVRDINKSFLK
jgi:spore coat polysaccharide biosynthesis protein SpsF